MVLGRTVTILAQIYRRPRQKSTRNIGHNLLRTEPLKIFCVGQRTNHAFQELWPLGPTLKMLDDAET
eukprot:1183508-Amphidinium_carterae.1